METLQRVCHRPYKQVGAYWLNTPPRMTAVRRAMQLRRQLQRGLTVSPVGNNTDYIETICVIDDLFEITFSLFISTYLEFLVEKINV